MDLIGPCSVEGDESTLSPGLSLLSLLASATTTENRLPQRPGQTWMNKEHLSDRQFVFKEPQEVNSCFFFNSSKDFFANNTHIVGTQIVTE